MIFVEITIALMVLDLNSLSKKVCQADLTDPTNASIIMSN